MHYNVLNHIDIATRNRQQLRYNRVMTSLDFEQRLADKDAQLLELKKHNESLEQTLLSKQAQLDWMTKQLFGPRSEKQHPQNSDQGELFENKSQPAPEPETKNVAAYTRGKKQRDGDEVSDSGLRFDSNVPVHVLEQSCAELQGPDADQYETISYRDVHKLASLPGSKVVLCYRYPVVRHKSSGTLSQPKAVEGVLGQSPVDVSQLADMMIEKFVYHLPLYRQHQRLLAQGFKLSRTTLGNWIQSGIDLLIPIADAIFKDILNGSYIKLDETPLKAGRGKKSQWKGQDEPGVAMATAWRKW